MGNELKDSLIDPQVVRDRQLHSTAELFKRDEIDTRIRDISVAQANLAYEKSSFEGNIESLDRERNLIKGPGYVRNRETQKRQFEECCY